MSVFNILNLSTRPLLRTTNPDYGVFTFSPAPWRCRITVQPAVDRLRALKRPDSVPMVPCPRREPEEELLSIQASSIFPHVVRAERRHVNFTLFHAAQPRTYTIPARKPHVCSECNHQVLTSLALDSYDRCSDCSVRCGDCGEEVSPTDILDNFNRGPCCTVACESCGETVESVNEYYYCEDCEVFCDECGEPCSSTDEFGRGQCCTLVCENCGCTVTNLYSDLCSACHDEQEDEEPSDGLHTYGYKPSLQFYEYYKRTGPVLRTEPTKDTLYFGVEVETEVRDGSRSNIYSSIKEHQAYQAWYGKEDSSLSYGIEHVSHPISIQRWRTQRDTGWMDEARSLGLRSWNTRTCGLHVHFPKSYLTKAQLFKLMQFFSLNQDYIIKVAGRNSSYASDYGTKQLHFNLAKNRPAYPQRRSAINTQPRNTYEVRIFKGTLNRTTFLRNLDWLAFTLDFIKHTSLGKLSKEDFHAFLESHRSKRARRILEYSRSLG